MYKLPIEAGSELSEHVRRPSSLLIIGAGRYTLSAPAEKLVETSFWIACTSPEVPRVFHLIIAGKRRQNRNPVCCSSL